MSSSCSILLITCRSKASVLTGFALILLGAFSGSSVAETSIQRAKELRFEFLVNTAEVQAETEQDNASQSTPDQFEAGDVLTSANVLSRLTQATEVPDHRAPMQNAYLIAQLWSESDDIFSHGVIAHCAQLEFLGEAAYPFAEQVRCNNVVYSIDVDTNGVLLLENEQPKIRYELDPGVYSLNGVPFLVE